MYVCNPKDVFITNEMQLVMANPEAMRMAQRLLFEAQPLLRFAKLNSEWILRHLASIAATTQNIKATLSFDGSFLLWREERPDKIIRHSWAAVSGRPGYQTKEYQETEDKGPIPEGKWFVKQTKYQSAKSRTQWEKFKNGIGRGKWPGGTSSWGNHRIWLEPQSGTKTYGRSGFSIHGGSTPGSAGCIDLTENMDSFVEVFRAFNDDVELVVKYP